MRATRCAPNSSAIRWPIRFRWTSIAAPRAARSGLRAEATVVALLPGSRQRRGRAPGPGFLWPPQDSWRERWPAAQFIAPMASRSAASAVRTRTEPRRRAAPRASALLDGQARLALQAADVALVASGTASLEALLCACPMVVAYRLSPVTAFMLRALRMVRLPYFSLPNLLAGEPLVPEFLQEQVSGAAAGRGGAGAAGGCGAARRCSATRFRAIHQSLRQGGAAKRGRCGAAAAGRDLDDRVCVLAGVDEAGRGPLAGPVVAAAVVLDPLRPIEGLRDSKKLTPARREELAVLIRARALDLRDRPWRRSRRSTQINILQATLLAMRRALQQLHRAARRTSSSTATRRRSLLICLKIAALRPGRRR